MATALAPSLHMPLPRSGVLDVSPLFAKLRHDSPVVRVTTQTGDPAWLVIAYDEAKTAFSDRRFGYLTHEDPENAARVTESTQGIAMGNAAFEAEMVRLRRLLTPGFTPRRMKLLEAWVQELVNACLDDMAAAHDADPDRPVDFHEKLGFRLPVEVIGALLGVPREDYDRVMHLSDRMGNATDGEDAVAATLELEAYMRELIERRRDDPGPDVISDLIRAQRDDPDFFATRPIEGYAAGLVFPGHETTVVRMDFGMLYLLADPTRRDWLMADPENRIDATVEEVLRLTSAHNHGLVRYALEDVELGGVTIRTGELVIISDSAANRDPRVFERPEEFDQTRSARGHLSFGNGIHTCLGRSLAMMELKIAFPSLFRRFPDVRLAVDPDDLEIDDSRYGGGVGHVPLTW